MMNKKGQGLPLNVIIIAIIVLVVLVVMIAIFTGRIALFERGVAAESSTELARLKVTYGQCQPSAGHESQFKQAFAQADRATDPARDKQGVISGYTGLISTCAARSPQAACELDATIVPAGFGVTFTFTPSKCKWIP